MAARTSIPSVRQQEQTRAAIKTTQLVKRLQHFALSEKDEQDALVEIDPPRLKAIEILLRKTLPDLSASTIDANVNMSHEDALEQLAAEGTGDTPSAS